MYLMADVNASLLFSLCTTLNLNLGSFYDGQMLPTTWDMNHFMRWFQDFVDYCRHSVVICSIFENGPIPYPKREFLTDDESDDKMDTATSKVNCCCSAVTI